MADLDRLAVALKNYKEQHGGSSISTGTCAGGSFDSDADLGFLADLERDAVIDAIPRDPAGIAKTTRSEQGTDATGIEDCDTMYGAITVSPVPVMSQQYKQLPAVSRGAALTPKIVSLSPKV